MNVLEKIKKLPSDKQQEVEDFVDYLIQKYQILSTPADETLIAKRKANMGRLDGQIRMADDFNETPEDFKEYM